MAQADKFRGHCFAFASSWTKVAQTDKFRGHFFRFASSWTKVAQTDKLKGRQCLLLLEKYDLDQGLVQFTKFFVFSSCSTFVFIWQTLSNYGVIN